MNEDGTEAAAATAVVVESPWGGVHKIQDPPVVFRADHPFLFFIRHRATGAILFLGTIQNPST